MRKVESLKVEERIRIFSKIEKEMFLLFFIFLNFTFAIDCFSCVYVETGNFTFGDENCAFGENDVSSFFKSFKSIFCTKIAWETCEDDVSGCFSLELEGSMNSTVFANSSALAVQRGCMLPDVEFCGEQLFRMVELNLIDNIGEAFGFNTTNFNISDPFLSANFTGERRAQIQWFILYSSQI